ncbi:hypothetical protein Tco_1239958, partial [Tanacetum coccineum]
MIDRLLNQMNNNRLSTGIRLQVDRDLLLRDLKVMLESDSNYEPNAEGKIVIKSSGKLLKKGIPIRVLILDEKGNNLKELESINACATYLVVYADSDSESDSESESNSSLSSAMTTYSFSHMNAVGIHHPADPSNVRPEDFSQPTQNPAQMNNAQQSMDTLLYNIYTERFPNNQLLFVNSPQLPSPVDANSVDANSIPPVAESSAQGAARAIRESAEEEVARARNANMEDSSSTSYKGKGFIVKSLLRLLGGYAAVAAFWQLGLLPKDASQAAVILISSMVVNTENPRDILDPRFQGRTDTSDESSLCDSGRKKDYGQYAKKIRKAPVKPFEENVVSVCKDLTSSKALSTFFKDFK